MSCSMKCWQCSSTFLLPANASGKPVACPHCSGTRVIDEKLGAKSGPNTTTSRPPLTDDDVLAFLGPPAPAKTQSKV